MSITASQALTTAAHRQQELELSYAGAMTPDEAFAVLQEKQDAVLVDVRTVPELLYVGRAPEAVEIPWQVYPDMQINSDFLDDLRRHVLPEQPVLFLCRSGVRSHYAASAAAAAGYQSAFNVLEGFEGDLDDSGHRGKINGWRCRGLPWGQS